MPQHPHFIASWSSTKKVHIWNIKPYLDGLDKPPSHRLPPQPKPAFTFSGHSNEGFAMDWSPTQAGRLVTGDCDRNIHLWEPKETTWTVDKTPFRGHTSSVEDLQWSPNSVNVFSSCSADKTIRLWDIRANDKSQSFVAAHKADVNVISWSKKAPALLASGSDDSTFKIWDLRKFTSDSPVGQFKYHTGPITSIEWHPTDDSILAVSSADNSISIWDMSLERDYDAEETPGGAKVDEKEIPPQLYFVHQGQTNIKELHFHPQITSLLLSTAEDGFNLFKPSNME